MAHAALAIKPPPEYGQEHPSCFTPWSYPFRNVPERLKWNRYDMVKLWRFEQEWLEVPILEDFRTFMDRVARELEL